jgi:hypothetical protein
MKANLRIVEGSLKVQCPLVAPATFLDLARIVAIEPPGFFELSVNYSGGEVAVSFLAKRVEPFLVTRS